MLILLRIHKIVCIEVYSISEKHVRGVMVNSAEDSWPILQIRLPELNHSNTRNCPTNKNSVRSLIYFETRPVIAQLLFTCLSLVSKIVPDLFENAEISNQFTQLRLAIASSLCL